MYYMFILLLCLAIPQASGAENTTLTLQRAIEICHERHPDLAASRQRIKEADAGIWQAWSPENPRLSWEFEGIPRGSGLPAAGVQKMRFAQTVEFPTNVIYRGVTAHREVLRRELEYELVALDLSYRLKKAYWGLVSAREKLALAQNNARLADDFLRKAKRRYDVGEAANIEYVRARVEKARAENGLTRAQNELHISLAELNSMLVQNTATPLMPADTLAFSPLTLELTDLKVRASAHHPRLRSLRMGVQVARGERSLAWGGMLPTFTIGCFQQTIEGVDDFWGAELGISLPLWFPLRQRGGIQEATARLRRIQFEQQSLQIAVALQIETAYARSRSAETRVLLFEKELLAEAEEVYRIAQRSYQEGENSYLELLDAQRTLIEVQGEYIQYLSDYQNARAELELAVGEVLFE